MSGYIVHLASSPLTIDATGATEAEAWAELRDALGTEIDEADYECHPATDSLMALIDARGGAIAWRTLRDGTACTEAEREAEEAAGRARAEQAADIVAIQTIPDACAGWADTRREMHAAMATALMAGHPHVRVSQRGTLQWTAAAPLRHETAPNEWRGCPLALRLREAAEEMARNLGHTRWQTQIAAAADARRREKLARLQTVGRALYGPEWISPLARHLDVALRTVQRWAAGDVETPDWTADALAALVRGPRGDRALADLTAQMRTLEALRRGQADA